MIGGWFAVNSHTSSFMMDADRGSPSLALAISVRRAIVLCSNTAGLLLCLVSLDLLPKLRCR